MRKSVRVRKALVGSSLLLGLLFGPITLGQNAPATQQEKLSQLQAPSTLRSEPEVGGRQLQVTLVEPSRRWYRDWTIVGLSVGWILAVVQYILGRYDKRTELTRQYLLDSLRWFSGATQPRSIGIAVIEANWQDQCKMRPYWTRILAVQAIHLLARSSQADSRVEEANLDRIMILLKAGFEHLTPPDRERLGRVLSERKQGQQLKSGGINLGNLPVRDWCKTFPGPANPE